MPRPAPARRATDLTEDVAVVTALSNDVGPDPVFSRQIAAYGKPGDVVAAVSASGTSRNIVHALREARRLKLGTIAFVGYDGGVTRAHELAAHIIVSASQHVPRTQEAHATAHHVMRGMVGQRIQAGRRCCDHQLACGDRFPQPLPHAPLHHGRRIARPRTRVRS
jgi:D-sedoheptulose 7-phosphate isomerase